MAILCIFFRSDLDAPWEILDTRQISLHRSTKV
jgi:hypothetical protein